MSSHSVTAPKGRAKSCTSCRQVKLRCNVRDTYPGPCARCVTRKSECKMDPYFKRARARSPFGITPMVHNQVQSPDALENPRVSLQSIHPDEARVEVAIFSPHEPWLNLDSSPLSNDQLLDWALGQIDISRAVIIDLFDQFNKYYYVHLPILEPVESLEKLHHDSSALFWAVAFTASRHHPRHSKLYAQLREPVQEIISGLLRTPVPALKDFQALLIVCYWPLEVAAHSQDPSWMLAGFVVNAALHMGLDKAKDEGLFSHSRAQNSRDVFDRKYRRRTWMKTFQLSTQLCTWQGLQPHISSASYLARITEFCRQESDREVVAMTEIQQQVVRNTLSLDEFALHGPQVSLLHHMTHELEAIQTRHESGWSAAVQINLQGALLYLFAHCLLLADDHARSETKNSEASHFFATTMQRGHGAALQLIELIERLGIASSIDPACTEAENGGTLLLAHPKQHFRLAFQACLFLLNYLDCNLSASISDQVAAREAVLKVYQIFKQFTSRTEFDRAARTIEVLARSIVPGDRRIETIVKTRMGASLHYNAIWTAAKLRGRLHVPELVGAIAASEDPIGSSIGVDTLQLDPIFPWGIWDDTAYDELGLGLDDQSFAAFPGPMGPF
ncbi:hypothetical protein P154DRAFT_621331 [Amniculicola lignicola CBS 123094]|uniref:Zn(2)-C6 fungal-type domain-containing protein n=1 Tax=Amniculicola lignicola CBS 123094 TaxID=1392246 RepID=A0A6A5WAA6_9PLEO|nr:hypothetical protein P154DRAFT_621331 [Amniculicola lignicola CBS 123094]